MAKIHFLLKDPKSTEKTLIMFVLRFSGNRFMVSTKESVFPSDWDFTDQRPLTVKGRSDLSELRYLLNNMAMFVETSLRKYKNDGREITSNVLTAIIDEYFGLTSKANKGVTEYIEKVYIKGMNSDNMKMALSIGTFITDYQKNVFFSDMTADFARGLRQLMIKRKLKQNTIKAYTSGILRIAKKAAIDFDFTLDKGFIHVMSNSVGFEKVRRAVLSVDELMQLYRYDYNDSELREVVDAFIVMSFTGIRSKDAHDSGVVNFDGGEFYVKDTSKTNARVIVPQHEVVKEIIRKNKGFHYPPIAVPTFLRKLRKACMLAGIDSSHTYTVTIGGKKQTFTKPKYECISRHTSRRSFATNLHKAGVPVRVAMLFTGHKTMQQYMDYIMISEQEAADEYMNHPFFTATS